MQLVGFVPTALAIALVIVMVRAGAPTEPLSLARIDAAVSHLGAAGVTVVVAVAAAVSITMAPLQFRLVQWFEGYWSLRPRGFWRLLAPLRPLYRLGLWRQRRRYERVVDGLVVDSDDHRPLALARAQRAEEESRFRFPDENRLLPTTLGNVLRAAEDRAGVRYGIDSVTLWPRLHALLPESMAAGIEDEVTQLDVSVRLVVTWLIAGVFGVGLLAGNPAGVGKHPGWLLVVAAMFVMAQLSYRGAVESALAHGRDIEVAIDLYRTLVLDNARLQVPDRLSVERERFGDLVGLYQSDAADTPVEMLYRS